MQMVPVASSNLSSVGYENGTLYIRFHNGSLYAYDGVPSHIHRELMAAASHGHNWPDMSKASIRTEKSVNP